VFSRLESNKEAQTLFIIKEGVSIRAIAIAAPTFCNTTEGLSQ